MADLAAAQQLSASDDAAINSPPDDVHQLADAARVDHDGDVVVGGSGVDHEDDIASSVSSAASDCEESEAATAAADARNDKRSRCERDGPVLVAAGTHVCTEAAVTPRAERDRLYTCEHACSLVLAVTTSATFRQR